MDSTDCDKRYRALAYQYFGGLEASKILPYINLIDDHTQLNKTELNPRVPLPSNKGGPLHLGRCLVCYSFIDRSDRLHFLGGSVDNLDKRTKDVAEFISEFLDVLATCVPNLEKGRAGQFSHRTAFDNSIRRMSRSPWILCRTCQVAAKQIVKSYNEFKSLQAKFMSAIKLSLAMRTKEVVSTTGEDKDRHESRTGIALPMIYSRTVRKILMGGKVHWRKTIAPLTPYISGPPKDKEKVDQEKVKSANVKLEVPSREENPVELDIGDDFVMDDNFSDFQGLEESLESVGKEVPTESSQSEDIAPNLRELDSETDNHDHSEISNPQASTSLQSELEPEVGAFSSLDAIKIMKTEGMVEPEPIGNNRPPSQSQPEVSKSSVQTDIEPEGGPSCSLEAVDTNNTITVAEEVKPMRTKRAYNRRNPEVPRKPRRRAKPKAPPRPKREVGKPGPSLVPISELKSADYRRFRETIGQTMSEPAHRKMRRDIRIQVQKIDPTTGYPSRAAADGSAGGVFCWKTVDGKPYFRGVEIPLTPEGQYLCPHCTKYGPTSKRDHISTHIKKFHVDTSNGHPCDLCDEKFYAMSQLKEHKIIKHLGGYQCDICGLQLANRGTFYAHKKVKHEGRKPHVCDHCGRGFATRKDLTIHIRRHTGERPFVCHVCADAFIDKQALKQHMRKRHPEVPLEEGQAWNYVPRVIGPAVIKEELRKNLDLGKPAKLKPHKCDLCDRTMSSKLRLEEHLRSHHHQGEMLFDCLFCPKRFPGKLLFSRHVGKRHPEVPWVNEQWVHRKSKTLTTEELLPVSDSETE